MYPKVNIILLNYNGADDTIECLESLSKITYPNYNIVIVDNNSPDDSVEKILSYLKEKKENFEFFENDEIALENKKEAKKITFIKSRENNGYGHGNNIGIKYALNHGADYVLVLNNDTVVEPDFLEPMVELAESDEKIGIVSGKINFYDKKDIIWFNGGALYTCTGKTVHFNINEKDVGQKPKEPITFITGCMWLIPRKILKDVGLINEEYFMYVEDVEYCYRVLKKRYKLKVVDRCRVYHKSGASSGGHLSEFSVYWSSRNKIRFIKDNFNSLCKLLAYFYNGFFVPMKLFLKGRRDILKVYLKGLKDGFK